MENKQIRIAITENNYNHFVKGDHRKNKMHRHIVVDGKVLCGHSNVNYIFDDDQSYAMKFEWDYPYCARCAFKTNDHIVRWINEDPLILNFW